MGFILRNWRLKSLALAIAVFLWVTMRLSDNRVDRVEIPRVQVQVDHVDRDWYLRQTHPASVEMGVSGPMGELLRARMANPSLVVRVDSVFSEDTVLTLVADWVSGVDRSRVTIEDFMPSTVRLRFGRMGEEEIPVSLPLTGSLSDSLALVADPRIDVLFVSVRGPVAEVDDLETVFAEPFDLGRITASGTYDVQMDTLGLGLDVSPMRARIIVAVAARVSRTLSGLVIKAPAGAGQGGAFVLEPSEVSVRLSGPDEHVAGAAPGEIGVELDVSARELIELLQGSSEIRVGLRIVGLSRWIEGALDVDSVTVRRPGF